MRRQDSHPLPNLELLVGAARFGRVVCVGAGAARAGAGGSGGLGDQASSVCGEMGASGRTPKR
jgi:hypothetical protein